jgi:hypothetical protein
MRINTKKCLKKTPFIIEEKIYTSLLVVISKVVLRPAAGILTFSFFSAPAGEEFGYKDGWISDDEFIYTGEGQCGDMKFVRGNKAIRDHLENGKQLHLFEHYRIGEYKYLGEFQYRSFEKQRGKDIEGRDREVIRFRLALTK